MYLSKFAQPTGFRPVLLNETAQFFGVLLKQWHRQITRQQVEQSGNVSRSLNRRVAAKGEYAAAGPPDIPNSS